MKKQELKELLHVNKKLREIEKYIEEEIDMLFEKFAHNTVNDEIGNRILTARIDELTKLRTFIKKQRGE